MTIFSIPAGDVASLNGGAPASPTPITPSGQAVTVILTPGDNNTNGNFWFALDSSFDLGAVVEIYATTSGNQFGVKDENGLTISPNAPTGSFMGARMRKVMSGTPGVPTWGVI